MRIRNHAELTVLMISAKAGLSDAPPTRKPSTSAS